MSNINKTQESGRSMVEMLGVLAVIGVLSVTAIAGYKTAMDKHRANQILNAASVRAMSVSAKLQRNSELNPIPTDFSDSSVAGATFVESASSSGNNFTLTVNNVNTDVCAQITKMVDANGNVNISEDCKTFTYMHDLSAPVTITPTGPVISCPNGNECAGCQTCQGGVCKDNNASCPSNGTCTNGYCSDCPKGYACGNQCCVDGTYCGGSSLTCLTPNGASGCSKNADCNDTSKFCSITFSENSSYQIPSLGSCESKGSLIEISYNDHTFYVSDSSETLWAAENLCLAHGKKLANLTALGFTTDFNWESPETPCNSLSDPGCIVLPGCKSAICNNGETDEQCVNNGCPITQGPHAFFQTLLSKELHGEHYWVANPNKSGDTYRYISLSWSYVMINGDAPASVTMGIICE